MKNSDELPIIKRRDSGFRGKRQSPKIALLALVALLFSFAVVPHAEALFYAHVQGLRDGYIPFDDGPGRYTDYISVGPLPGMERFPPAEGFASTVNGSIALKTTPTDGLGTFSMIGVIRDEYPFVDRNNPGATGLIPGGPLMDITYWGQFQVWAPGYFYGGVLVGAGPAYYLVFNDTVFGNAGFGTTGPYSFGVNEPNGSPADPRLFSGTVTYDVSWALANAGLPPAEYGVPIDLYTGVQVSTGYGLTIGEFL